MNILLPPFLLLIIYILLRRRKPSDPYSLDHATLNAPLFPQTMWMNMGYWKHTSSFPEACHALFTLLLERSGLLASDSGGEKVHVIDLGIGCGDQTLAILRALPEVRYTGITNNPMQLVFLEDRMSKVGAGDKARAQLCLGDGADPDTWNVEVVDGLETWILALDCLYHFRPDREKTLRHAVKLGSLVAFDLLLDEKAKWWEKGVLWVVAIGMGVPYGNFLTPKQYTDMLVAAGYMPGEIEIEDISSDVFGGLTAYIRRRSQEAEHWGVGGWRKWKVAGWVFGLWDRWGMVRGCVVVARRAKRW
ncbi:hypothetical protein L873DRAFT_1710630 [Choiromyces venosus 120613-1]|uniref:S-adenosyl-L-methionine-dependent methyltransferase n=1 Tax=Choiromyces venosus 120613-1 TaxID=1336337 RepID=A0A3N4J2A1_9PEZI|nr:hypothetical protein L873DRAFT_1710630 [Choiromyces venosus 120613-1]